MTKEKERLVQVDVRHGIDLNELVTAGWMNVFEVPCGSIGLRIAKQVHDGNGSALIPMSDIAMAIDNTSGVNAILDRFDLTDPGSQRPLLHVLLQNVLKSRK